MSKLVFVYNADSSLFAQVTDFAHKLLRPKTYSCSLCKLSYGNFTMKNAWREFLSQLKYEIVFLHKNDFKQRYPGLESWVLPVIFIEGSEIELLMSSQEINSMQSLDELISKINEKIK